MPKVGDSDCQTSNDYNSSIPILMRSDFMFNLFALLCQVSALLLFFSFSLYMKEKLAGKMVM